MNPNFFNLSKRKKRDILSELLVDNLPEGIVSKKELNAVNRMLECSSLSRTSVTIKVQRAQPEKKVTAQKTNSESKIKTTYYLSKEISENLNTTQIAIRSYVPKKFRSMVSMSHIVNQALVVILQEFETKGKDSRLMRTILQKL
jgi:hypothetical protein